MEPRHKQTVRIVLATAVIAASLIAWLLSTPAPDMPVSQAPLEFDAGRALGAARAFVTRNPDRLFGSLESRQSSGDLIDSLSSFGYEVEFIHFDARVKSRSRVGRNVLALRKGESDEIVALVAHYDTAATTVEGGMKNGAAVGVLLELARVFSRVPTHRSLLFIFTDGGEWGNTGAADLAARYPLKDRIAAVLSLDHVAPGELEAFRLEETGQVSGFTPPWLRRLAAQAASAGGLGVRGASRLGETVERALQISSADQGPFLRAGIAAVNLGSVSTDRSRARELFHSPGDGIASIRPESVHSFGLAAERIVRSLDEAPEIPREAPDACRSAGGKFLAIPWVRVSQLLWFLPLCPFLWWQLAGARPKLDAAQVSRELWAVAATFLPFLVLFLGVRLTGALRLLPVYPLYPATARDPVLVNPDWRVLGAIFGAAALIALTSWVVCRYGLKGWPEPRYAASKAVLLALLILVVALAFARNSHWAWLFLLLPAWLWTLIGRASSRKGRALAIAGILAGAVPSLLVLGRHASDLYLGWNYAWYHALALHNGLFTPAGYFLGALAVTLGIRFIVISPAQRRASS
ncbi:MAG: M28 family peptidase [Acidobacteria bacterium]|nr:M28 family peptidase [Acidobacteriota bacterium]